MGWGKVITKHNCWKLFNPFYLFFFILYLNLWSGTCYRSKEINQSKFVKLNQFLLDSFLLYVSELNENEFLFYLIYSTIYSAFTLNYILINPSCGSNNIHKRLFITSINKHTTPSLYEYEKNTTTKNKFPFKHLFTREHYKTQSTYTHTYIYTI